MNLARRMMKSIFGLVVLLTMCAGLSLAGLPDKDKAQGLQKTTTNDVYRPFLINNIFNYYGNNGDGSYNKFSTDNEGFEFLKGDGKHVIFEDGVVWGGYHKGRPQAKVGGSVYRHGLQAGPILTNGTATADPVAASADDQAYRIYRVRPDINPKVDFASVEDKLNNEEVKFIGRYESYSAQDLYNQYVKDWNEWPADLGAPFTYGKDANDQQRNSGPYDPRYDTPGQPGSDQTLWYVANDCSQPRVTNLAGCPLIGLEMQRTVWGYKRSGALGQTVFASSIIINKSGARVDSMYLVQWADPDLGDAGDDFAGCDTSRSLGYIYNGKAVDGTYGTKVPAGGFTFFQGPIVPGAPTDSAIFKLKYRHGFKNLKMSAFVIFSQGIPALTDPRQGPNGDFDWYNLMRGLIAASGNPFIDPTTGLPTKFVVAGDPVTGIGYIDGMGGLSPQDRRICLVTGPFTMAPGDTQELVVANLAGVGADRISSITVMRSVSDQAQQAYNSLFKLPAPPPSPVVTVAQLDGQIVLSWGDPKNAAKTETTVDEGFTFEGYKVYELPGPSTSNPILIGTFDLKDGITAISDTVRDPGTGLNLIQVLQNGSDNGLVRNMVFNSTKTTGGPLIDGTKYFYGVTAYSYNANPPAAAGTHSLESPISVITAIPQSAAPGTRYSNAYGDTVKGVTHSKGVSDGTVIARVVNPQAVTGDTYKVVFGTQGTTPIWNLVRFHGTRVDTVAKYQTDQSGDDQGAVIVDGIEFRVLGAPDDFKDFGVVANAHGALSPEQAATINSDAYGYPHLFNNGTPNGTLQQSAGLTASQGWTIATGMNAAGMDPTYPFFVSRVTQGGARWPLIVPNDFEIRFTPGKALIVADFGATKDVLIDVPFQIWNIGSGTPNNASDDYQLFPYILDVDNNAQFNLLTKAGTDTADLGGGGADHSVSGGTDDPFTDWIYWVQPENTAPGHAGYDAIVTATQAAIAANEDPYLGTGTAGTDVLRRMVLVGWNFGAVATGTYAQQMPEAGTVFRIVSTKPNTPNDEFTISAPALVQSTDLAKGDVSKITVFPNPYIGFNPAETNKYARFVTFYHLPAKATIRIFNLAGILVRTVQKNDATQFVTWDLNNTSGFPVSAGMYIAYIEMPDLGVTKTLKLGVIPEQQTLDRW